VEIVKIGDQVLIENYTIVDSTTFTTTSPIYYAVSGGARVRTTSEAATDRLSNYPDGTGYPDYDDVWKYGSFFPAMYVDIGTPDPTGWNLGERGVWKQGTFDIWRRDYTNAIVLCQHVSGSGQDVYDVYTLIDLEGNYRRLRSDGTLDDPISEIQLRPADGAILFPAGSGPSISSASVNAAGNTLTVNCSESVAPATGITGFTISSSSGATCQNGTSSGSTITIPLTGTIIDGDTVTIAYSNGNVTDAAGSLTMLAASGISVTNNSTVSGQPATISVASTASNRNESTDDRTLVIDVPSGTSVNDILVAVVQTAGSRTCSPPDGWTERVSEAPDYGRRLYVWTKKAESADTSGTFTFTGSSTYLRGNGIVLRLDNAIDQYVVGSTGDYDPGTSTITCPNITVASNGSLLLSMQCNTPAESSTQADGTVEELDSFHVVCAHLSVYSELADAGAWTGRDIVLDKGRHSYAAATIAISPQLEAS